MRKELDFARKLFEIQNIPSFVYDSNSESLESFDGGLRKLFFPDESYRQIKSWIIENCTQEGNIYILEDFLRLAMVVVPLDNNSDCLPGVQSFFVAAPFTFEALTDDDIAGIAQKEGFGENAGKSFYKFYHDLPQAGLDRDKFQSFLCVLFPYILKKDDMRLVYHYFEKDGFYLYPNATQEGMNPDNIKSVEDRYAFENLMLESVRKCDSQTAIYAYKKLAQSGIKPRSTDPLRNLKNYSVVLNSHLRKVMEKSGVHPFYVDDVSGDFAVAIEQCTNNVQLFDLAVKMIKSYCQQIYEHKIAGFSSTIQKCILYIDFHFAEYLSLQVVANELYINASHLSAQFKKETGITLTSYINRTRIEHSLPLLLEKSRSIESIANECGFGDMNYFARVFKKITGVTPTEYRNSHRL